MTHSATSIRSALMKSITGLRFGWPGWLNRQACHGFAFTTGEVLIASDGTPWRPLVHVEDICRAFLAILQTPKEAVHNQAFNVGRTEENYQIRDIAAMVEDIVPGSRVKYAEGGGPDLRCYRVNCDKIARTVPGVRPKWTVLQGIEQLYKAYKE